MARRIKHRKPWRIERLKWKDVVLGDFLTPRGRVPVTLGLGSGLSVRARDGSLWSVADRGPNMTVETAIERHRLPGLGPLRKVVGAKILPRPDVGPMIASLRIRGHRVELLNALPLRDRFGRALSGLPLPGGDAELEGAFDLAGRPLGADPCGADTEGIAALDDGTFWVADEYGPSLLRVAADGQVMFRVVPQGASAALRDARYPVKAVLPRIASRRRLNRGFEALALSKDRRHLHVLFQSALSNPGRAASERGRYARLWTLAAQTGRFIAQYLYPFDAPQSFARDARAGEAQAADLKICDAVAVGARELLVLERISRTAKVYRVRLDAAAVTPRKHLQPATRPTLEQMSPEALAAAGIRLLEKTLVFSTDDAPKIDRDLEGLALLSPCELLLVTDNDFGVEGARTRFWRVTFRRALNAA
jgi:hypothetical protein